MGWISAGFRAFYLTNAALQGGIGQMSIMNLDGIRSSLLLHGPMFQTWLALSSLFAQKFTCENERYAPSEDNIRGIWIDRKRSKFSIHLLWLLTTLTGSRKRPSENQLKLAARDYIPVFYYSNVHQQLLI